MTRILFSMRALYRQQQGASHGRPGPADVERESHVLARPFFWRNDLFRRVHRVGGSLRLWRPLDRPAAGVGAATDDGTSDAARAAEEVAPHKTVMPREGGASSRKGLDRRRRRTAGSPAFAGDDSICEGDSLRLRDELLVGVGLEPFQAAFVAVAGILDAAERRFRRRDHHRIHADHAGLDGIADHGRGLRR